MGKEVEFVTIGEDTEVDKLLSEGLADPLMHMVRYSVDHGQQSGDERVAAGKNRKGRIELSARCEGGFLVVRLSDDGKGLDTEAILAKARAKGIVGPKQELTDQQIFALIFQPSFSRKAVVTEVSGRGVGMDVVQTNIHAMRGHIDIQSQRGKGTAFTLTIPLAISLLDGMIFQLGDEKWILPLHMVVQLFRHGSCELSHVVGVGEVLTLRGENIPVTDLAKVLQVPRSEKSHDRLIIVAKDEDLRVALVVDAVIGIQTVVSKPLTPEMQARDGIAGCAILGDGKTSLILEIARLHKSAARAGEQGKGFAVVAEEVGNLAQMSGLAAKEISDLLEQSVVKVQSIVDQTGQRVEKLTVDAREKVALGEDTAKRCASMFEQILLNADEVNSLINEIATSAQEQARGVQEINSAMTELDNVTQQNSSSAAQPRSVIPMCGAIVLILKRISHQKHPISSVCALPITLHSFGSSFIFRNWSAL